ncbi:MAG: DoxX family protein [Parasphingopyxis sp.]|nr:DoxX family protein [Sphingomonadales bacterium]
MKTGIIPVSWSGPLLSLLRIVAALMFIAHGTQKYFGVPANERGVPELLSLPGVAGIFELVFGVLILIGFATRISAFLMSGMMAIAYWMVHFPQSYYPSENGGEPAIFFCFVFLYIAAAGPGPWSIDGNSAPQGTGDRL